MGGFASCMEEDLLPAEQQHAGVAPLSARAQAQAMPASHRTLHLLPQHATDMGMLPARVPRSARHVSRAQLALQQHHVGGVGMEWASAAPSMQPPEADPHARARVCVEATPVGKAKNVYKFYCPICFMHFQGEDRRRRRRLPALSALLIGR